MSKKEALSTISSKRSDRNEEIKKFDYGVATNTSEKNELYFTPEGIFVRPYPPFVVPYDAWANRITGLLCLGALFGYYQYSGSFLTK